MRYRIVTIFFIVFLLVSNLYEHQVFLENRVLNGAAGLAPDDTINIGSLYNYDEVEYFYITTLQTGENIILANNKYYEDKGLAVPKTKEYYGNGNFRDYESIGSAPYLDLTENTYYLNLDEYKDYEQSISSIYFYSDNKEKMLEVEKNALKSDNISSLGLAAKTISIKYYIFKNTMILFFALLILMFLFVDINLYNKELAIKNILGYSFLEILQPIYKKQILHSLTYFLFLLIPIFILKNNSSVDASSFSIGIFKDIIKIYILSNILYILAFGYTLKKSNIIMILKGKIDAALINGVSLIANILSKILIVVVLSILIIPSFQMYRVCDQYVKYIRGNENYVRYNTVEDVTDEQAQDIYEKYNEDGAILNVRSISYEDSPEYNSGDQIMIANYNYMKLLNLDRELKQGQNYLLIPETMKNSASEIKSLVEDSYFGGSYELKYYDNQEIYSYRPTFYSSTAGYIYYPIILVADDWTDTIQNIYMLSNMFYLDEEADDSSEYLTEDFTQYFQMELKSFILILILSILFMLLIIVSTYYMFKSYIEIDGKEIIIKKILGYSNFKIYKTFYILDFIYYAFGTIYIYLISKSFLIPLWFNIIFIVIIISLNEYNRKSLIDKVERKNKINLLKGEV